MSPKGRGSNEARRNRRLSGRNGGGTQSGKLRSQLVVTTAVRRSWWERTKEWWAEKFRDAEATVAPRRAMRRAERTVYEQKSVGEMKQTQALGQVRRKR
jgi:hypothetical protein